MKKSIIAFLSLFLLVGAVSAKAPAKVNGLDPKIPARFFTWVKADCGKTYLKDVSSGKIVLAANVEEDILYKVEKTETGYTQTFGAQSLNVDSNIIYNVFTAMIASGAKMANDEDCIDEIFSVLTQIFADKMYTPMISKLPEVLSEGLEKYADGGEEWEAYKVEHFTVADNVLKYN